MTNFRGEGVRWWNECPHWSNSGKGVVHSGKSRTNIVQQTCQWATGGSCICVCILWDHTWTCIIINQGERAGTITCHFHLRASIKLGCTSLSWHDTFIRLVQPWFGGGCSRGFGEIPLDVRHVGRPDATWNSRSSQVQRRGAVLVLNKTKQKQRTLKWKTPSDSSVSTRGK